LSRSDFESATRAALRDYVRSDLLAANALMRTRLLEKDAAGTAAPIALKALLADTAEALFANARDERLYRVLDLTYFNPTRKQQVVAQQLGDVRGGPGFGVGATCRSLFSSLSVRRTRPSGRLEASR
jgi:anti-sigma factor RsiW